MGAMIAGLYAESDMDVEQRAKEWFMVSQRYSEVVFQIRDVSRRERKLEM